MGLRRGDRSRIERRLTGAALGRSPARTFAAAMHRGEYFGAVLFLRLWRNGTWDSDTAITCRDGASWAYPSSCAGGGWANPYHRPDDGWDDEPLLICGGTGSGMDDEEEHFRSATAVDGLAAKRVASIEYTIAGTTFTYPIESPIGAFVIVVEGEVQPTLSARDHDGTPLNRSSVLRACSASDGQFWRGRAWWVCSPRRPDENVVAAAKKRFTADLRHERVNIEVPPVDRMRRAIRQAAALPLLRVCAEWKAGVKDHNFVGDAADLREERCALVDFQVSVEMACEDARDRLCRDGQSSRVAPYHWDVHDLDTNSAQCLFTLIEGEPAAGKLRRERAGTGTEINKHCGREPCELTHDLAKFFADRRRRHVYTEATEVPKRARHTALVVSGSPVVVGP